MMDDLDRLAECVGGVMLGDGTDETVADVVARLRAEVERLRDEGTPGVMHAIDRAFYDLTIKERNAASAEVERLREALRIAEDACNAGRPVNAAIILHAALEGTGEGENRT